MGNAESSIATMCAGSFYPGDANDSTGFDATRGVGYIMDLASSSTAVVGTLLLTSQTLNYSAIDNETIYRALWGALFVSTSEPVVPNVSWGIHFPYPHPAVFPVTFRFETVTSSVVALEVCDLLGRRVQGLLDAQCPAGIHELAGTGQTSSGTRVAPGVYMLRMRARHDCQIITRSRPVTVIR